jgi:branched-chain amino acid transport system permease protein
MVKMDILFILDILIGGLILGGLYALISFGLGLQIGVARVLNVSHGEFIMIGAFATYSLYVGFGIDPLCSLVITAPIIFLFGFFLHRTLFSRLRKSSESVAAFEGNSLLASFGILFIIQNMALLIWGPDIKGYTYLSETVNLGGIQYPANRLLALFLAVGLGLFFYFFVGKTRLGKAIRAAAQDPDTAQLMGVNINSVLGICFGLGASTAVLAGSLISTMFEITPSIGLPYTVVAMIAVVLGGLGNIMGSLIGGFILGLIGNIVLYIHPGLFMVAYYIILLILLLIKPKGLFGE